MSVEARAPGKVILFGEHSVVYKGPAIVIAIDKMAKVTASKRNDQKIYFDSLDLGFAGSFENGFYTPICGETWRGKRLQPLLMTATKTMEYLDTEVGLDIKIRSEIPIAAGLGSSAAICVATVASVGELLGGDLSKQEICDLSYEGEKVVHGTPSGVDNNISTFGGIIRFERNAGLDRFELDKNPPFIIGNSLRKRSTRRLVGRVKALMNRETDIVTKIVETMEEVSNQGLEALKDIDLLRLGDLMNINHGLLSSLGVSTSRLDILIHASRGAGAYGAKLTGAGGGGCMIAVASPYKLEDVRQSIYRCRGEPYIVKISYNGVTTKRVD